LVEEKLGSDRSAGVKVEVPEEGPATRADLDAEQRSLNWDSESERGFLPNTRGTCAAFRQWLLSVGKGCGEFPANDESEGDAQRRTVKEALKPPTLSGLCTGTALLDHGREGADIYNRLRLQV
jgi:hypothetical protein